ncbi:TetR/AcrR family transcriptional regulator [Novosphingobium sp. BW1]|uniref:TetR/AcrR family transcriptional regulator n=1 Tax=Novosphingobium sp. BW1 TaxID=2592621 RepID=UPI0013969787|nr:TetR/AcrR family transcriptional regulator [Novosphingobium sp. BW1]
MIELIETDGYRRQTLREIGQALAIEPAHILYYFGSREELLQQTIEFWDAQSFQDLLDPHHDSGLDLFVAAVRRNCEAPGMGHLFLSFAADAIDPTHSAHAFFKRRVKQIHADLSQAVRQEQEQGRISLNIDSALTARQLMALADGLQLQSLISLKESAIDDLARSVDRLRSRTV